jgi:DNA-binding response OmpR family regulator
VSTQVARVNSIGTIADVPFEKQIEKRNSSPMKKMITTEITSKAVRPRGEQIAIALTVIEFPILQALASRPGIVKSRDALMVAAP